MGTRRVGRGRALIIGVEEAADGRRTDGAQLPISAGVTRYGG
jgi:hypothetical protein